MHPYGILTRERRIWEKVRMFIARVLRGYGGQTNFCDRWTLGGEKMRNSCIGTTSKVSNRLKFIYSFFL